MGWWAAGYWAGADVSAIPWSWGYWPYYNPYCTGPIVDGGVTIDYSQPIVVAQAAAPPRQRVRPPRSRRRPCSMRRGMPSCRATTDRVAQVDQAIALVPNDTVLHEFRGLALFALGRYKEAAAADYAVLSAGPGWDWTTLSSLYPNVDVYTEQLRALEQYAKAYPAASEARFLLAYHYLTCGYTDAAAAQLKEVVRLNPKDQLSAQLLASISAPGTAEQAAPSPRRRLRSRSMRRASWATGRRRARMAPRSNWPWPATGSSLGRWTRTASRSSSAARIPLPTTSWSSGRAIIP